MVGCRRSASPLPADVKALDYLFGAGTAGAGDGMGLASDPARARSVPADLSVPLVAGRTSGHRIKSVRRNLRDALFGAAGPKRGPAAARPYSRSAAGRARGFLAPEHSGGLAAAVAGRIGLWIVNDLLGRRRGLDGRIP